MTLEMIQFGAQNFGGDCLKNIFKINQLLLSKQILINFALPF